MADPQGEALRRMEGAGAYNRWLFERCRPHLGRRVLDAGAGSGTFSALAAEGREVVAVEPDSELLGRLHARFDADPRVRVVAGTADDVSGPFDSIVCLNVLEHIQDDGAALGRFHDLLVPGGALLLLVPAHPFLFGTIDHTVAHERRYRKHELAERLRRAGFRVDELRHVNPLGGLGWFVSARVLRREHVPEGPLRLYDRLVPVLRALDRVDAGFGLSLWVVASRPA